MDSFYDDIFLITALIINISFSFSHGFFMDFLSTLAKHLSYIKRSVMWFLEEKNKTNKHFLPWHTIWFYSSQIQAGDFTFTLVVIWMKFTVPNTLKDLFCLYKNICTHQALY